VKEELLASLFVIAACGTAMAEMFPIIDVREGYLVGAIDEGKWIEAKRAVESMKVGSTLPIYDLSGQVGKVDVVKVENEGEPCPQTPFVILDPKQPERGVIAFAPKWNPLPRKAQTLDVAQDVYVDLVRKFLIEHKIRDPVVNITQILRIDLDGDGEDEVLISATHYERESDEVPNASGANTYSFVMLRRVVGGKVKTELVVGEFYPKAKKFNAPNKYEVAALLDLNGDGKIDIVVHSTYYEGDEIDIFECGKSSVKKVLSVGCGA
jgi:hypothetical protein